LGAAVKALRAVLDTTTLVSAVLFRSDNWSWLRAAWKKARIVPVLCPTTTRELIRVLNYPKFKLSPSDQQACLAEILPFCETSSNPSSLRELPPCRDLRNQVFIELAQESLVDCLVSEDKHVQEYPSVLGVRILSAASLKEFIQL
jgi:putative PIN family toxin of toxin-antitoxin system